MMEQQLLCIGDRFKTGLSDILIIRMQTGLFLQRYNKNCIKCITTWIYMV